MAYIAIKFSKSDLTIILSYIFLILGNNYPIYFGFKKRQGVGVTIGFGLTLFPIETLISFLVGTLFSLIFHFFKFQKVIKFMGPVPFGAVFGLITIFILLIKKYPFYPFPLLILIASIMLLFRGLQMVFLNKKKHKIIFQ